MQVSSNNDSNRHLPELDRKRPLGDGKVRGPLDYLTRRNAESQLEAALEALGAKGRTPEPAKKVLVTDLQAHLRTLIDERDNYEGRARDLDAREGSSKIGDIFMTLVVFLLDWLAFAFSCFILLDSLLDPLTKPEFLELVIYASAPGALFALMVKVFAHLATKNPAYVAVYVLPWILFAVADLTYLFKMKVGNVGFILTGLLVAMAFVTYAHAKHKFEGQPRKALLESYAEAYRRYQLKRHQWQHSIVALRSLPEPTEQIDRILQEQYFDFDQAQDGVPQPATM